MTTYSQIRDTLKSGDLVFTSHSKWNSFYNLQVMLVRLASLSEFSHVGVVVEIGKRVFIAESVSPLVRLIPLSNYADEGFYVSPTNTPMSEGELEFLMSKVGVGTYSKWQAVKAWFNKLNIGEDNQFECGEYVLTARRMSGAKLGNRAVPASIAKEVLLQGLNMYYVKNEVKE
jgi:hypothetical protein